MAENINYISCSPHFFLRLSPELIVWGHQDLPHQIHLTCSLDHRSSDANFHVTKENGKPPKEKPKVTIAKTDKSILENGSFINTNELLNSHYEPLILQKWRNRRRTNSRNNANYIRLDNLEHNPSATVLLKNLKMLFDKHSKITQKSRLKINESILQAFEDWAKSETSIDFIWENLRPVSKYLFTEIESGYWVSSQYSGPVIAIRGCVYKPREDVSSFTLMGCLFDSNTKLELIEKFLSSIAIVSAADCYQETAEADDGVRVWE